MLSSFVTVLYFPHRLLHRICKYEVYNFLLIQCVVNLGSLCLYRRRRSIRGNTNVIHGGNVCIWKLSTSMRWSGLKRCVLQLRVKKALCELSPIARARWSESCVLIGYQSGQDKPTLARSGFPALIPHNKTHKVRNFWTMSAYTWKKLNDPLGFIVLQK